MSSSLEKIKKDFPLHFAVFNNDAKELDGLLQQGKVMQKVVIFDSHGKITSKDLFRKNCASNLIIIHFDIYSTFLSNWISCTL